MSPPGVQCRIEGEIPFAVLKVLLQEVEFSGWLSHAETQELLRSHDVMIAPYREASQSGVVAEALAWGLPVVATPVGALAEQIGDGRAGWLSDPGSFGATLISMLDDPGTRASKARAAHDLAREFWGRECWDWLADLADRRHLSNVRLDLSFLLGRVGDEHRSAKF